MQFCLDFLHESKRMQIFFLYIRKNQDNVLHCTYMTLQQHSIKLEPKWTRTAYTTCALPTTQTNKSTHLDG